ncbi:MAG TPA: HepT-like ribonuclease domain-containing protein [Candidatus Xenobia bacterium]
MLAKSTPMQALPAEPLRQFAVQHDLEFIALFGSQARHTEKPGSDLDLALMPRLYDAPGDALSMGDALARALQRADLDTTWLTHASWVLASEVARDGVPLYECRPGTFQDWCRATERRHALDSGVWRKRRREGLLRALANNQQMNRDLLEEKLAAFAPTLSQLQSWTDVSKADFVADVMRHRASERNLLLLVEYAGEINTEIAASNGLPQSDYYSSFFAVSQVGWISPETAQALAPLASLRNTLVHAYARVSLEKLYDDLKRTLPYWADYAKTILAHL